MTVAVAARARQGLLLMIAVILAVGIAFFWLTQPEPVRVPQMRVPDIPADELAQMVVELDGTEVASRPLFWESRRPVILDEESEAVVEEVPTAEGIKLLGVIMVGGQGAVLISDGDTVQRVLRGESFAGWRVDDIKPTGAVLSSGRTRVELPVVAPPSPAIHFKN